MKKITFLFLIFCSGFIYGQTMLDNFESGATNVLNAGGGITTGIVTNPNQTGLNTTANCMEIKRTGAQWWIFQGIDINDLAISSSETKYVSMMVHFPAQSDLGIRFDAPDDASNGVDVVRPLNAYTNFNQWQEIIFEIKDNQDATAFTLGTLFRISIHPDMGFENDPAGQVLDNVSAFGYIDQIQILDSNPLLSNEEFALERSISVYQNASLSSFRIETKNNINIADVSLYDILGSKVNNISKIDTHEYDMSNLTSGLYIVKIRDDRGEFFSKKLIKQ